MSTLISPFAIAWFDIKDIGKCGPLKKQNREEQVVKCISLIIVLEN